MRIEGQAALVTGGASGRSLQATADSVATEVRTLIRLLRKLYLSR